MKKFFSILLIAGILGISVFTLFYVFKIQIQDKRHLEKMSALNKGFKQISKISIDQLETRDFEGIFETYSQNGKNPGLAIGISFGVRTFPFYFGKTDQGGTPLNNETFFEIGAVTQPLTGLLLARMMESEQIPSDPLLQQILGSATPHQLKQIKMIDLATHTAGFPSMPPHFPKLPPDQNPFAKYSADDLWKALPETSIENQNRYHYSNYGYAVLGESLRRFRGTSFPQLLRQEILSPLVSQKCALARKANPLPLSLCHSSH